ncbi:DUF3991 domain-containing protein [Lactiplantibacillus plantarum]|uniref:DUF3991 domain-containing protein n=1 Tax=Lactiplantibacillus plantarum TaxID=1590 RepID=UPI0008FB459A|nr:DUF3991 domain-containing protein [Lactiplantibacillus plantarum]APB87109.1 hypothetical protein BL295_15005 [Lactiplantibacillus plantarum]
MKADYTTKSAVGPVAPLDAAGMAYLTQYRHLDSRLITFAARQGLLGSDGYHNVIFNWFDAARHLGGPRCARHGDQSTTLPQTWLV